MMRLLLAAKNVLEGENAGRELKYYIVVDMLTHIDGTEIESYGICLRFGEAEKIVRAITFSRVKIESLLACLAKNTVTPTTLLEVIDDLLDDLPIGDSDYPRLRENK